MHTRNLRLFFRVYILKPILPLLFKPLPAPMQKGVSSLYLPVRSGVTVLQLGEVSPGAGLDGRRDLSCFGEKEARKW